MNKGIKSIEKDLDDFKLKYTLYESDKSNEGNHICYSVCVEKTDGKGTDKAYANDISPNVERALEIFDMLIKNDVTPISLWDIIEEKLY